MSERKRKDHLDDKDDIKRKHVEAETYNDEHKVSYTFMSLYCYYPLTRVDCLKLKCCI